MPGRIHFKSEGCRVSDAAMPKQPFEDAMEILGGSVVLLACQFEEFDRAPQAFHPINAQGDALPVVLGVEFAADPEEGNVAGIGGQPRETIGRGQRRGGGEQIRVVQGEICRSRSTHRVAGEIDAVFVHAKTLFHVGVNAEDVVFADPPILGGAASVGRHEENSVFLSRAADAQFRGIVLLVLKKAVLVVARLMERKDHRNRLIGPVAARNVDPIGLVGVIDFGTVGKPEVLSRLGSRAPSDQRNCPPQKPRFSWAKFQQTSARAIAGGHGEGGQRFATMGIH